MPQASSNWKKVTLELGGHKSLLLFMPDADMKLAIPEWRMLSSSMEDKYDVAGFVAIMRTSSVLLTPSSRGVCQHCKGHEN